MSETKWGAGHAEAMLRQGAKELAQCLPAFPESVRVVEEPGLVGNVVPQEVMEQKGNDPGYEQWLQQRAEVRELPDMGMER